MPGCTPGKTRCPAARSGSGRPAGPRSRRRSSSASCSTRASRAATRLGAGGAGIAAEPRPAVEGGDAKAVGAGSPDRPGRAWPWRGQARSEGRPWPVPAGTAAAQSAGPAARPQELGHGVLAVELEFVRQCRESSRPRSGGLADQGGDSGGQAGDVALLAVEQPLSELIGRVDNRFHAVEPPPVKRRPQVLVHRRRAQEQFR